MQRKYAEQEHKIQRIFLNHNKKYNENQARRSKNCTEPVLYPLRIYTADKSFVVNMYYLQPILLCRSNIAKQNFCQFFNVICDGSWFWIYMVIKTIGKYRQILQKHSIPPLHFCNLYGIIKPQALIANDGRLAIG